MSEIVNKVANSGLITLDLEEIRPEGERVLIDISDQLIDGFVLREKDFRAYIKSCNWNDYKDKHVAIVCTADAIVPTWAFMCHNYHKFLILWNYRIFQNGPKNPFQYPLRQNRLHKAYGCNCHKTIAARRQPSSLFACVRPPGL